MRDSFVTGEWTVRPSRNLLVRGDDERRVEPRLMDVLLFLAERPEQVVSKEDLIAGVWPDRHVTDDVLTVTIYGLRKSLGDEARRPRYIETVSRRGYRWIAPVQVVQTIAAPVPAVPGGRWSMRQVTPLALLVAAIVVLIALSLGRPHSRHVPTAEAHEASVKGRFFLDQRSIKSWQQAHDLFQHAVALDPADPAAQAGLADSYSAMWDFGVASRDETRARAMSAAARAIALDPQSAEGYAALGRAQFLFDWDFGAAEHNLSRALAIDPDYMPAHQTMAWVQSADGHYDVAIRAARRALQLDPVNTSRYTELAWVLGLSGRYDEALHEIDRALQLHPHTFEVYLTKAWVCEQAGRSDAAFAAYRDALREAGMPEPALRQLDAVYRADGLPGCYRQWLGQRAGRSPMSETRQAQLYVRMGERDRALALLEDAYQKREGALAWVNVEPSFATLHADARFQRIAAQVHRAE